MRVDAVVQRVLRLVIQTAAEDARRLNSRRTYWRASFVVGTAAGDRAACVCASATAMRCTGEQADDAGVTGPSEPIEDVESLRSRDGASSA
jgi:hypothetical protein